MKILKIVAGVACLCIFIAACQKEEEVNLPDSQLFLKSKGKPLSEKKCEKPEKDTRDGQYYSGVLIGTQCWMSRNLAYLPEVSPPSEGSDNSPYYYVYGYEGNSESDAKQIGNYLTYGVLYNWPAAMNREQESNAVPSGVQGICPHGWHLPSDAEWTTLMDYLGPSASTNMKSTSGWSDGGNGNNSSGFNALPGGFCEPQYGKFLCLTLDTYFWSTTTFASGALGLGLHYDFTSFRPINMFRRQGISVRCLKD